MRMIGTMLAAVLPLALGCPLGSDEIQDPPDLSDDDGADDDGGDDDGGDDDGGDDDGGDDDTAADLLDLVITYHYADAESCYMIHAGRMVDVNGDGSIDAADPSQLWLVTDPWSNRGTLLLGHDGTEYASVLHGEIQTEGTLGEVDPAHPGLEWLAAYHDANTDTSGVALFAADGTELWDHTVPEYDTGRPWLTDLDGDGSLEALVGRHILDAHSGNSLGVLEDAAEESLYVSVAADLDLDGAREIISMTSDDPQEVNLYGPDGAWEATCWTGHWQWAVSSFAVGDLDGDPEGEFVAATTGYVVTCDSDGSLIAEAPVLAAQPAMTALAQLDGDDLPEIVIGDAMGITALDTDLTELWTYDGTPSRNGHHPIAVADLDGDGRHEILVRMMERLVILDHAGDEAASITGKAYCSGWISAPAILDVDADGLAEILVPAWPGFAVVENPYGGWAIDGAQEPWPSLDKHPGDRTPDGGIPAPLDVHWAAPATNVWQGLPLSP